MSMYALQVMTGMEAEITQKLRGKGVDARCANPVGHRQAGAYRKIQMHTKPPAMHLSPHRAAHFVPWVG